MCLQAFKVILVTVFNKYCSLIFYTVTSVSGVFAVVLSSVFNFFLEQLSDRFFLEYGINFIGENTTLSV